MKKHVPHEEGRGSRTGAEPEARLDGLVLLTVRARGVKTRIRGGP